MRITDYGIQKLIVPCEPPISDSQTDDQQYGVSYVELDTETGDTGIGFGGVSPSTPPEVVERRFERVGEELVGESPFHLVARMQRSRGGNYPSSQYGGFGRAVDFALWDLCGKHLDMPLYELLGGEDPQVPAYASGLLFTVDDREVRRRYEAYADRGFDAAKVKVGYPTIREDIDRIELVRDAMGGDVTLTVDANEAFSPKEAIRRAHAYRDAGLDIYWFEDPVIRADVDGIRRVAENVPFSLINTGEYVNVEGKRELLENGACDLLNIRSGLVSESLDAAALAHAYAVPTHVGHAAGHIGVHLAAALPEPTYIEWWDRPWDAITEQSVTVEDGHLIAPNRPGHGVTLQDTALAEYGNV